MSRTLPTKRCRNCKTISQNSRFNSENQREIQIFYENYKETGKVGVGVISMNVSENFENTTKNIWENCKKHRSEFGRKFQKNVKVINICK